MKSKSLIRSEINYSIILEKIDQGIADNFLVSFSPKQDINKSEAQAIPPKLFKIVRFLDWKDEEYLQFREPGKELDPKFFKTNYSIEVLSPAKLNLDSKIEETGIVGS
jgi:hypothetical protein